MAEKKEEVDLPWWQKLLLLSGVCLVIFAVLFVSSLFNNSPTSEVNFSSCETRFDSTPCPEPDYEQTPAEAQQYPDADPYGDYIDRP